MIAMRRIVADTGYRSSDFGSKLAPEDLLGQAGLAWPRFTDSIPIGCFKCNRAPCLAGDWQMRLGEFRTNLIDAAARFSEP